MEGKRERNEGMGGWVIFFYAFMSCITHDSFCPCVVTIVFCRSKQRWTRTGLDHSSFGVADNKNAGVPIK